jgi:predicted nucleic acid-binding protein
MHVFIDTNILLNFFHFSKDELDALNNVFASHEHGSAVVHLTEQVCDEFKRNREGKIKDALKRFREVKFVAQLPSFMKGYEEFDQIKKLSSDLQKKSKSIIDKVNADIAAKNLLADRLIGDIFSRSEIKKTTKEIYENASMRMAIGNPPGKNSSIGDAINWILLLESVPNEENLHIISEDGDFYSTLYEKNVHPFLEDEWRTKKNSSFFVYRTLSDFMKENFDGVAFSFDKNKEALIDELKYCSCFAVTHDLIGKLEDYSYFSAKEVERILSAAVDNSQFGWIVTDYDVSDFLNRVAVPHLANISNPDSIKVLEQVVEEQKERAEKST